MNTTYTILVSSILMILLSGFGWFAAMKEIKCFLLTYFVLLFLLSIITMIGGVLAYVFREQVAWTMKAEMVAEVRNYLPDQPEAPVTRAWDMTQSQLHCCGLMTEQVEESWQVWRKNQVLNPAVGDSVTLPRSCCSSVMEGGHLLEDNLRCTRATATCLPSTCCSSTLLLLVLLPSRSPV